MSAPPQPSAAHSSGRRLHFDPWLGCAALLALIPILTIVRPGMPNTADGQVHLLRALEASRLLNGGVLYPRWAPDFYFGYGYPFFNFYAPGAHLLISWIALTGLGVLRGMVAAQVLSLLLYPTGAYLAARTLFTGRTRPGNAASAAALLSAALYLYAPLRWRELFVQGNLSQLLALALLPWCAWTLTRAARDSSLRWATGSGLLLAILVYLHHPSALLAFPSLAVYAFAVAFIAGNGFRSPRTLRSVVVIVAAFCLSVLLSAPFWLPSIAEQRYVNIASIEQGMFNVRSNLLSLSELFSPARLQDEAALNPPMPNSLGIAQSIMALTGLLTAILWTIRGNRAQFRSNDLGRSPEAPVTATSRPPVHASQNETGDKAGEVAATNPTWSQRQAGTVLLVVAALLLASLVVMLPVAAGAWEALPLARLIAFPWRMMGPALLWSALLGGAALFLVPSSFRGPALAVLLVLAPLSIAPYLFPRAFAPVNEPGLADITRYEIGGGARGTASANEYLPRWVSDPDPPEEMAANILAGQDPNRLDGASLPAGANAETILQAPLQDIFRLTLPEPAMVRIRRFYFPGWSAWVDGRRTAIGAGQPYGVIEVPVPAGTHEIRLRHEATVTQQAGGLLALAGLALASVMIWLGRRDRDWATTQEDEELGGRTERGAFWIAAATILVLTTLLLVLIGPYTRWFRLRSSVDAPAGMEYRQHALFANGVELIGYTLSKPTATQGDTVAVRLFWRALRPQTGNAHPFLHLDAITGDATWANQTKVHAGDKPSMDWPSGFYVVDDYRLPIAANSPPVIANLRAGLLDERGERVPLTDGGDVVSLGPLRVRERRPPAANTLPGHDHSYQLGPAVRLIGSSAVITGTSSVLDLTLYWQATAPVPADYTAFIHVLDADDNMIAQGDGPPLGGWYPSSAWEPEQIITDRRQIPLPAGVDPARLRVAVGLYTPVDGVRAAVTDSQGTRQAEDRIVLVPSDR